MNRDKQGDGSPKLEISSKPTFRIPFYLSFLWYNDPFSKEPNIIIIILHFLRVVFGNASSPFLLNATIKCNLFKCKTNYEKKVVSNLRWVSNSVEFMNKITIFIKYNIHIKE